MKKAIFTATMMATMMASTAYAVGDPPRRLSAREAAAIYKSVRPLLSNDAVSCPVGQVATSATITGGAAPGAGSQTTTILFDKGAKVVIARTWDRAAHSAATSITCS